MVFLPFGVHNCTVPPEFFTHWVLSFKNEKRYLRGLRAGAFQPMRPLSDAMNSCKRVFSPKKLLFSIIFSFYYIPNGDLRFLSNQDLRVPMRL